MFKYDKSWLYVLLALLVLLVMVTATSEGAGPAQIDEDYVSDDEYVPNYGWEWNSQLERMDWFLDEEEIGRLMLHAGFSAEEVEAGKKVVRCESGFGKDGSFPFTEGDGGRSFGVFQIYATSWTEHCDAAVASLYDPLENAKCARRIYEYDLERGNSAWWQWTCKMVLP